MSRKKVVTEAPLEAEATPRKFVQRASDAKQELREISIEELIENAKAKSTEDAAPTELPPTAEAVKELNEDA